MPAATSLNKCYTKTQFPFASTGKKKSNLMNSPQNIDIASKLHEGVLSSYHKKKEELGNKMTFKITISTGFLKLKYCV